MTGWTGCHLQVSCNPGQVESLRGHITRLWWWRPFPVRFVLGNVARWRKVKVLLNPSVAPCAWGWGPGAPPWPTWALKFKQSRTNRRVRKPQTAPGLRVASSGVRVCLIGSGRSPRAPKFCTVGYMGAYM